MTKKLRFNKRNKEFYKFINTKSQFDEDIVRTHLMSIPKLISKSPKLDTSVNLNDFDEFEREECNRLNIEEFEVTWNNIKIPNDYILLGKLDINDDSIIKFLNKSNKNTYKFIIKCGHIYTDEATSKDNEARYLINEILKGGSCEWIK